MQDEEPEIWNMPVTNSRRDAGAAGFQAKQLEVQDDAPIDDSWRQKQPRFSEGSDLGMDVQAREMAENRVAREARQKIDAILAEDETPQRRRMPQQPQQYRMKRTQGGGLGLEDLMEGMDPNEINSLIQHDDPMGGLDLEGMGGYDGYDDLYEDAAPQPQNTWGVFESTAKLKSGKTVRVWMVADEANGFEYKKPFRLEEAAQRVAGILGQSGNINDPRIKKVVEAHDQYVKLVSKGRKVKQAIQEGRKDLKPQYQQIREQIEGVSYVLGI